MAVREDISAPVLISRTEHSTLVMPTTDIDSMAVRVARAAKNVNYQYFVDYIRSVKSGKKTTLRVLDYGCGRGYVMRLIDFDGIDMLGVDNYIYDDLKRDALFKQGRILAIEKDGKLPFEDASFDLIITQQVFEHVENKEPVFDELRRVLKLDGIMLHHIPTKDIVFEGHLKIPLYHWFSKGKLRDAFTYLMLLLGFGKKRNAFGSKREWVENQNKLMDSGYVHYEKSAYFRRNFEDHFVITPRELEFIRFRASKSQWGILPRLLDIKILQPFFVALFRRLAFHAFELRFLPREK